MCLVFGRQLSVLAKERHESFAQRKTLQDLMDAVMKENENLHEGLAAFSNVASSRLDTTDNCEYFMDFIALNTVYN